MQTRGVQVTGKRRDAIPEPIGCRYVSDAAVRPPSGVSSRACTRFEHNRINCRARQAEGFSESTS